MRGFEKKLRMCTKCWNQGPTSQDILERLTCGPQQQDHTATMSYVAKFKTANIAEKFHPTHVSFTKRLTCGMHQRDLIHVLPNRSTLPSFKQGARVRKSPACIHF